MSRLTPIQPADGPHSSWRRLGFIALLALVILALLPGCGEMLSSPGYVVHNDTRHKIPHLVITDVGPVLNYSKLDPGETMKRQLPNPEKYPRPRSLNVYWEDHDGRSHHQRVDLWKHFADSYEGSVLLTVTRSGTIRASRG